MKHFHTSDINLLVHYEYSYTESHPPAQSFPS